MNNDGPSRVARAILDYLQEHPEAQDTLAGISEWWLAGHEIDNRTATIKEALDELASAGLIIQHEGKDAQTSYRTPKLGLATAKTH
jgi:Fe2+ or Zn2+ uptake regulation protein